MTATKAPKPLTPPDPKRCQCEKTPGSFMTLGPRTPERCANAPTRIVREREPGADGRRGAMSLCDTCFEELRRRAGLAAYFVEVINREAPP